MFTVRRIGIRSYYFTAALATLALLLLFWLRRPLLDPPKSFAQMSMESWHEEKVWKTESGTVVFPATSPDEETRKAADEQTSALRRVLYRRDLILIVQAPLLWVWLHNMVSLAGVFRPRLRLAAGSNETFTLRRVGLLWAIAFGALSGLALAVIASQLESFRPSKLTALTEGVFAAFENPGPWAPSPTFMQLGFLQESALGEATPAAAGIRTVMLLVSFGESPLTGPLTPLVASAVAGALSMLVTVVFYNLFAWRVKGLVLQVQREAESSGRCRARLLRIQPLSALRLGALVYLARTLFFTTPVSHLFDLVWLYGWPINSPEFASKRMPGTQEDWPSLVFSFAGVVAWPLWALVYNWLARRFGGLELEVAGDWPATVETPEPGPSC